MTNYKYQEQFASELYTSWLNGNHSDVRTKIRNLKNKAQAAYIAAHVATLLANDDGQQAVSFCVFIHPNNQ